MQRQRSSFLGDRRAIWRLDILHDFVHLLCMYANWMFLFFFGPSRAAVRLLAWGSVFLKLLSRISNEYACGFFFFFAAPYTCFKIVWSASTCMWRPTTDVYRRAPVRIVLSPACPASKSMNRRPSFVLL
ncbi:hypothetical protein FB451DRAFT_1307672 [Mycena latifolia]|nr:hypothetical protein FB451DRAFT_1307672 [Mycena latifolia]